MIEPGRPQTLGKSDDQADAAGLLSVIQGCSSMRQRRNAGTTHVARQALWSFWELPRLPRPLVQNKYPAAYPWSAQARSILTSHSTRPTGGWGLVLEHLTPRNVLLRDLIERADELNVEGARYAAVVTDEPKSVRAVLRVPDHIRQQLKIDVYTVSADGRVTKEA